MSGRFTHKASGKLSRRKKLAPSDGGGGGIPRDGEAREKFLAETYDMASVRFLSVDADGTVREANSSILELLGLEKAGMIGSSVYAHIPDSERENFSGFLSEALKAETKQPQLILQARRKSGGGELFFAEVRGIRRENGRGKTANLIVFDISVEKEAENLFLLQHELILSLSGTSDMRKASETTLETCMRTSRLDAGAVYLVDEKTGCVDLIASKGMGEDALAAFSHFGPDSAVAKIISRGKAVYTNSAQISSRKIPPASDIKAIAIIPIIYNDKAVASLNFGSSSCEEIPEMAKRALNTIAAGGLGNVFARLKMEAALKESEERFRLVADFNYDWEYWMSENGDFMYVSPSCERITGHSAREFLEDKNLFQKIMLPGDWPKFIEEFKRSEQAASPHYAEFRITCPDGERKWIGHVCQPVFGKDGKYLGRRGSNRDITEKKTAEEALVKAMELTEQATRAKSEFLANMSHEIRTPLNAVIGFTELLMRASLTDDEKRKCLRTIKSRSEDLLALINDILDLSRIEAGKMNFNPEETSLPELLEKVRANFAEKVGDKGLDFEVDISPDIPEKVVLDPTRTAQILNNLVGNSVKFTERGLIRISLGAAKETELPYSIPNPDSPYPWLESNSLLLHFSVSDTGIGIPADKQKIIFEAFAQADGTTARKYGGSGLGLAICTKLVELMCGCIWVESEPGRGSSFHVIIRCPLASQEQPPKAEQEGGEEPPADYPGENIRVLLVEDDEISRAIGEKLLNLDNITVTTAVNGVDAIHKLDAGTFDLILMDIEMPEMDGVEAARIIRDRESKDGAGHIPIVAVTAHTIKDNMNYCIGAGMDEYVTKPINYPELITKIKRMIRTLRRPAQGKSASPPAGKNQDLLP